MATLKIVERDAAGNIAKVIETDSTDAVALRCAELQKALAIQLEHNRLVESRFTEMTESLMRETTEQRAEIAALTPRARLADRLVKEVRTLREALARAEQDAYQESERLRVLRESQRRRSKVPYWHRIGKLVNS